MSLEMKLIVYFLYFTVFRSTFESDYRLYHSHYAISNNDHDCFYRYENSFNGLAHHLVPYCIRSSPINLNKKCLGTPYTFDQLRSNNIKSENLYQWFAPIDIIDNYATYLLTETINKQSEQIYCNCSDRRSWGTHCQYEFTGQKKLARHVNSKFRAHLRLHFLPKIINIVQL